MPHPRDLQGSLRWRSSEKVHLVDKGSETMGAIVFPWVLLLSGLNMRPYIYIYIMKSSHELTYRKQLRLPPSTVISTNILICIHMCQQKIRDNWSPATLGWLQCFKALVCTKASRNKVVLESFTGGLHLGFSGAPCLVISVFQTSDNHHRLGCIPNLVSNGWNYQPQLVNTGFLNHQQNGSKGNNRKHI